MKKYTISRVSLYLLSIATIASLKDIPALAEYGPNVIFYLILALIFFFLPITFISIELTTLFPREGGVYLWVREAFGNRLGFVTIWLQWMGNIFWFPTMLSFAAAIIAYILYPPFAKNQMFMVSTVLFSFWGLSFLNTLGLKVATRVATLGALIGTLLPGIFIILLGVLWYSTGNQTTESFEWDGFFPLLGNTKNLVYLSAVLLAFLGMELPAVHIEDIEEPKKDYPRALIWAMVTLFFLFLFGSLAVSSVVPKDTLNIETGVMQGLEFFFQQYNIRWMTYLFAILTAIGAFSNLNVWILGPTKALMVAGKNGDLPPFFHKKNENMMPTNLLILQAILVTILSLVLLMVQDAASIYWLLGSLTANLYIIMYMFIFVAALILRKKYPVEQRQNSPNMPAPLFYILFFLGMCAFVFGIGTNFVPLSTFSEGETTVYEVTVLVLTLLSFLSPFIILKFKKPSWDIHRQEMETHAKDVSNEE